MPPETRIARIFEEFLLFKADNESLADRSIRAYRDILVRFSGWLDGRNALEIQADQLLVFCGIYLHKQGLAPVSRTPYVACIREFYSWVAATGQMARNPAAIVPYPKRPGKLPRPMALENAERLMWAPNFERFEGVRDAAMLALLIGCGLRVSGLVRLNTSHIISQQIEGEARLAIHVVEKGKKERMVPIPREADLLLRVYLEHHILETIERTTDSGDQVLFVTTRNRRCPEHEYYGERRRFSIRGVQAMMLRHGKTAGIPLEQCHPHALRHLFGTELAEANLDLIERQKLMGHADPKTTAIYTHLAVRRLTSSTDRANPLGKISTPVSQLLQEMNGSKRRT